MSDAFDSEDFRESAPEKIESLVREGFESFEEIVEQVLDYFEVPEDHGIQAHVEGLVTLAFEAHAQEQETWTTPTDCDRLDEAFAALEAEGIVARQNFTCCQTCGHAEIWDEVESVRDSGREVRGYTFFHMQDTEGAAEGFGLCLAYGAVTGPEEPEEVYAERAEAIARRVQETLAAKGLEVQWGGSVRDRIVVELDWKKRRV